MIARIGKIEREIIPDPFCALVCSVVGQQISDRAADTVRGRLLALCGEITPDSITRLGAEELRRCGMSARKAGYIMGIAEAVRTGALPLADFPRMADAEVVERLSGLRGVGVWTAEMLLLFSLQRPDVLSWGDLALRRGMMSLYGHKTLTRERFERYRRRYSPYGSVAAFYLWELAHNAGQ